MTISSQFSAKLAACIQLRPFFFHVSFRWRRHWQMRRSSSSRSWPSRRRSWPPFWIIKRSSTSSARRRLRRCAVFIGFFFLFFSLPRARCFAHLLCVKHGPVCCLLLNQPSSTQICTFSTSEVVFWKLRWLTQPTHCVPTHVHTYTRTRKTTNPYSQCAFLCLHNLETEHWTVSREYSCGLGLWYIVFSVTR